MAKTETSTSEYPQKKSMFQSQIPKLKFLCQKIIRFLLFPYFLFEKILRKFVSFLPSKIKKKFYKIPILLKTGLKIGCFGCFISFLVLFVALIIYVFLLFFGKPLNREYQYLPSVDSASFFNNETEIKPDEVLRLSFINEPNIEELSAYLKSTLGEEIEVNASDTSKTVDIIKNGGWDVDQTYTISLPSDEVTFMETSFLLTFKTIESPRVSITNFEQYISKDDAILISFNSEVFENEGSLPKDMVSLTPGLIEKVESISPSTMRIITGTPFEAGIPYELRIKPDQIVNKYGLSMKEEYIANFIPETQNSANTYGSSLVLDMYSDITYSSKDPLVVVTVLDIDKDSFRENTKLRVNPDDTEIPISINWTVESSENLKTKYGFYDYYYYWQDNGTPRTEYSVAYIRPSEPWKKDWDYQLIINEKLKDINGELMRSQFSRSIHVPGDFFFISSSEKNGVFDGKVNNYYYNDFVIEFSNELILSDEELQTLVKISSLTGKVGEMYKHVYTYWDGNMIHIEADFRDGNRYKVEISPDLTDKYGNRLGQNISLEFEAKNISPNALVNIYGTRVAYIDNNDSYKILLESLNLQDIKIELAKVTPEQFMDFIEQDYYQGYTKNLDPFKEGTVQKSWEKHFDNFDDPNVRYSILQFQYDVENLNDGLYVLRAYDSSNSFRDYRLLSFSKYATLFKKADNQFVVWASDTNDGMPFTNKELTLQRRETKIKSITDSDGIAEFSGLENDEDTYSSGSYYVYSNDGTVFVSSQFDQGMSSYSFLDNYYGWYSTEVYYGYFDRPVYKAGQEVNFKVFGRKRVNNELNMLDGAFKVRIDDAQNNTIYSNDLNQSEFGTVSDTFILDKNALGGLYYLYVNEYFVGGFRVSAYKPLNFSFRSTIDEKEAYKIGDTVNVDIDASYYFGEPLSDAEVQVNLYIRDASSYSLSDVVGKKYGQYYSFPSQVSYEEYGNYNSKQIGSATIKTNSEGHASLSVPITLEETLSYGPAKTMSVEIKITDKVGMEEYKTLYKTLLPKGGTIGISNSDYSVNINDKQNITVNGMLFDENFNPAPNRQVLVEVIREDDRQIKKRRENGVYYWETVTESRIVNSTTMTTNSKGEVLFEYLPTEEGYHKVKMSLASNPNIKHLIGFYAYSYGGYYFNHMNNAKIQISTDKDEYKVGETAKITPELPSTNFVGLVAVEREKIIDYKVVRFNEDTNLQQSITGNLQPNFYYSVFAFTPHNMGADFLDVKMGIAEIHVTPTNRDFGSTATTDKEIYYPQETVELKIDSNLNKEVEYMVAVVDKAVLDLSKLTDKKDIQTELVNTFWENWGYNVDNNSNLTIYENKHAEEKFWGNKGGSGDGGSSGPDLQIEDIRREFKPVALWIPSFVSNNGDYSLEFDVPDNLTTWTIVAIGLTKETQFSVATKDIQVANDVSILSSIPSYIYENDEATITYDASFKNVNEDDLFGAKIEIEGGEVLCKGDYSDSCYLDIKSSEFPISYTLKADRSEEIIVRFGVTRGGKTMDAEERSIKVNSNYEIHYESLFGDTQLEPTQIYTFPDSESINPRKVKVVLSDSVVGSLDNIKNYFIDYQNQCSEQTASKIQALIPYIDDPEVKKNIEEGIQRLYELQNLDGGWGIWEYDESSPYTSIHAYETLTMLKSEGVPIDETVLTKAEVFVRGLLNRSDLSEDIKPMIWSVLADQKSFDIAGTNNYYNLKSKDLPLIHKAYILNTYVEYLNSDFINPPEREDIKKRIDNLNKEIILQTRTAEGKAYWQDDRYLSGFYYYYNDIKTTAVILDVFLDMRGDDPALIPVINYLKYEISYNQGMGTQSNLYAFKALRKAKEVFKLGLSGALPIVNINGKSYPFFKSEGDTKILEVELSPDTKEMDLKVESLTDSLVFYQIDLEYDVPFENVKSKDRGLAIVTEYFDMNDKPLEIVDGIVQFDMGKTYKARTTIFVKDNITQTEIRIPTPAGLRVIDFNLNTSSDILFEKMMTDNENYRFLANLSINEEDVVFYTGDMTYRTQMPRGIHTFTYYVRASYRGKYETNGEWMKEMYLPGRGAWQKPVKIEVS